MVKNTENKYQNKEEKKDDLKQSCVSSGMLL